MEEDKGKLKQENFTKVHELEKNYQTKEEELNGKVFIHKEVQTLIYIRLKNFANKYLLLRRRNKS